jgi:FGGY-family pentulose kinase
MADLLAAVDVGAGSARAGILDARGRLLGRAGHPIEMHTPLPDHAEHDSEQIWSAVCAAVRAARLRAGARADAVAGIGFDATCSLVVRGDEGRPVTVSTGGDDRRDTLAWLDHRAAAEAEACTASGHRVLDYLGGVMSPEMQVPKLMWLKRHLPESWSRARLIFDLADFLTWKASGATARSQCTLACKWTYLAHETPGWQADFLAAMGLTDLRGRAGLPEAATPVAADLGPLAPAAAQALGLSQRCRVATALVDAHAGALGVLGRFAGDPAAIERHLALIAGTSSCVMAFSRAPRMTRGVWGPHLGAVLPGFWTNEGGQSASGGLLDHICRVWGAGAEPSAGLHDRICGRVAELRAEAGRDLAARLHVLPDFHGNRTPLADPRAVGVISGLTLDASFDGLCRLYWRTAVAIALGVRQILDTLNEHGYVIDTLHVTGGHTRNPLLMELYADGTGCRTVIPAALDAVLLGTAMAAATAAGLHPDLTAAGRAMDQGGAMRLPDPAARPRFDRDYRVFLEMHRQRERLDALIAEPPPLAFRGTAAAR